MEVALVLNELGDGDVLDRDGIVGVGGDHRVPVAVILRGGQQRLEVCEYGVIDFDLVRTGSKLAMVTLPKLAANTKVSPPASPAVGAVCGRPPRLKRGRVLCA
ncbi:MAG: hypothetical protein ACM30D_11985 [Hyphomicrobiales bacterium]